MLAREQRGQRLQQILVLNTSIYDASPRPARTRNTLSMNISHLSTLQRCTAWTARPSLVQFCVPSQNHWSQLWFITANVPSASQGDSSLNMEEINNISHVCSAETKCDQLWCLFIWDSLRNTVKNARRSFFVFFLKDGGSRQSWQIFYKMSQGACHSHVSNQDSNPSTEREITWNHGRIFAPDLVNLSFTLFYIKLKNLSKTNVWNEVLMMLVLVGRLPHITVMSQMFSRPQPPQGVQWYRRSPTIWLTIDLF